MSQIKWLPEAVADIERLHIFLYSKNPDAAARAMAYILEGAELLKSPPHIGRPMSDDSGRRELFIPFSAGSYVLRYMLEGKDTSIIIRVWHCKKSRGEGKN